MFVLRLAAAVGAAAWVLAGAAMADPPADNASPPAATGAGESAGAGAAGQPATAPQRRHCVADNPTGSFISHRTCYTEEQWQARREAEEERRAALERLDGCNRGASPVSAC